MSEFFWMPCPSCNKQAKIKGISLKNKVRLNCADCGFKGWHPPVQVEQRQLVERYVAWRRRGSAIPDDNLPDGHIMEPGCDIHGEGRNHVEIQLVHTKKSCSEWGLLEDPGILEMDFRYVVSMELRGSNRV